MSIDQTFQIKRLKSPDGTIRFIKDNKLHNPDGPALIHPDGKEEYYFYGIYKGNTYDAIRDFKRNHNGLPPAKNPMFKSGL